MGACIGLSERLAGVESATIAASAAAANFVQDCQTNSITASTLQSPEVLVEESNCEAALNSSSPGETDEAKLGAVPLRPPSGSPSGRPHATRWESRDPAESAES